jgi:prepilin-type N-terminal cleavage/methylation domain-containing protein
MRTSPTGNDRTAQSGSLHGPARNYLSTRTPRSGRSLGRRHTGSSPDLPAFTLIELLVVLAILSIVFLVATPSLISFVNPARTKSFMSEVQSKLTYAGEKAILEKRVLLFNFDMDERVCYFTQLQQPGDGNEPEEAGTADRNLGDIQFPDGLEVAQVQLIPGDTRYNGKVVIPFTPTGMLLSFAISVRENEDRLLVLTGNSFNGKIELGYRSADQAY